MAVLQSGRHLKVLNILQVMQIKPQLRGRPSAARVLPRRLGWVSVGGIGFLCVRQDVSGDCVRSGNGTKEFDARPDPAHPRR